MLRERIAVSLKNELLENFFMETLGASKKKKHTIDECSVGHPSIPFSLTASPGLWRGHTLAGSTHSHLGGASLTGPGETPHRHVQTPAQGGLGSESNPQLVRCEATATTAATTAVAGPWDRRRPWCTTAAGDQQMKPHRSESPRRPAGVLIMNTTSAGFYERRQIYGGISHQGDEKLQRRTRESRLRPLSTGRFNLWRQPPFQALE